MSDTTPERTAPELPDAIEQAIMQLVREAATAPQYYTGPPSAQKDQKLVYNGAVLKLALDNLRQAIHTALEPDRALPDRTEHISNLVNGSFLAAYGQGLIDIADQAIEEWQSDLTEDLGALFADDLAATSSAHEGRE